MRFRRALAIFLPSAVVATALCGLVYVAVQQDLRTGANDPQQQIVEDAAARLDGGALPAAVIGRTNVDIARSLAPFVVVYDQAGAVLATDGILDGAAPRVPGGVLDSARATGRNAVTWQPRPGVRVATVTVPWSDGTVLAGRSLRVVEDRVDPLGRLVAVAWIVMVIALGVASAAAASLWPEAPTSSADDGGDPGRDGGDGPGSDRG